MVRDLSGAQHSVASGLREVHDPPTLLKLYVTGSWADRLTLDLPARDADVQLEQLHKRFGDDPRILRFGLNRLAQLKNAPEGESLGRALCELCATIADSALALYPLLGRDLAEQLGRADVKLLIRLAVLCTLSSARKEAQKRFFYELGVWNAKTGLFQRYHVDMSPADSTAALHNLEYLATREPVPAEVWSALAECFRAEFFDRTDQMLYEEIELEPAASPASATFASPPESQGSALVSERDSLPGSEVEELITRREIAQRTVALDAGAALALFNDLVTDQERILGKDHVDTLQTRADLAEVTGQTGDFQAALELLRALLPIQERVLGADHPQTLRTRAALADVTGKTGDANSALALLHYVLSLQERVLGSDHPDTLTTRHNIARWTAEVGDLSTALALYTELLSDRERVLGNDHPDTRRTRADIDDLELAHRGEGQESAEIATHEFMPSEEEFESL
jgi:hypothetical protein